MFAVIETGGKQYRVEKGDVLDVELLPVENRQGEKLSFDRVLMVFGDGGTRVGNPVIPGARVEATLVDEVRAPKVRIFKHKKRKGHRRRNAHRQDHLRVRVESIVV
ncbi:MAG: 50S ribosomal protein L21 [Thermoanaerobaculia bacterium]|jgi:large subunit ribosomal protein L21|nr:MAG: 50S ribosomal protein L21 [Thermoanaerobaculia bacterium]MBZ0102322.1 50S ribosomal protein L21 [Thermoanaerobaculia bacterium]